MSRIYSVAITTAAPRNPSDPGSVAIGFYVIENVDGKRLIRMVTENGDTVELNGVQWVRELQAGDVPRKIAAQLTLSIRLAATEDERGFHRRLTPEDYWPVPA
jgi:hypothetical protein